MKATEALLADHKMIRKLLQETDLSNPRFPQIVPTLRRIVLGHAWFEDIIFLPAVEKSPLLQKRMTAEMVQEHEDIAHFLTLLNKTIQGDKRELEPLLLQLQVLLATHFDKEEDAIFPLAERILDEEGMNRLGDEMRRRQTEALNLIKD